MGLSNMIKPNTDNLASASQRPVDSSPENGSKSSRPEADVDTHDKVSTKKVFVETYG
jgi:hypothetical protein